MPATSTCIRPTSTTFRHLAVRQSQGSARHSRQYGRLFATASMKRASWNGAVVAESDKCERVEGNYYFPPGAVRKEYFKDSNTHTTCGWKGVANYYSLEVDGQVNKDAAWYYPEPKDAAKNIKDYVAFWKGVKVE